MANGDLLVADSHVSEDPAVSRGSTSRTLQPRSPGLPRWAIRGIIVAKGVGGFVAIGALWELGRAIGLLPSEWAPSVVAIFGQFFENFANGMWARVLASTLLVWLVGLVIAVALGVLWGAIAGASKWFRSASAVVISFLRPVPAIALVPVAILALGLRPQMILALVVFGCIWPVLFNTLYAFRELPEQYSDTARMLGHGRLSRFVRVDLVAILPGIVTGVRVSAAIGLVVAVSVELIVGSSGLGGYIVQSRTTGQIAAGYAGILMGGLLGVVFAALLGVLQRRALHWSPENRKVEP